MQVAHMLKSFLQLHKRFSGKSLANLIRSIKQTFSQQFFLRANYPNIELAMDLHFNR